MTEQDYLASYDPTAFEPLAVAVDVTLLTVADGALQVLLVRRDEHPARGKLALPGAFVGRDEALAAAARRALRTKVGADFPASQFETFGRVDRDPRMRIISVGHLAVTPFEAASHLLDDTRQLARINGDAVRSSNGRKLALPFDHGEIVTAALRHLRAGLDHSFESFGLLPEEFSLRELQQVHEAIRGEIVNKPAFRKRLIESGKLEPTGRRETDKGFRPAELYRVRTR